MENFRTLFIFALCLIGMTNVSAQQRKGAATQKSRNPGSKVVVLKFKRQDNKRPNSDKTIHQVCTTTKADELADLLGESIYYTDSLVVKGPIGKDDFNIMWRASAEGGLSVLNLEYAEFPDNAVPDNAFWNYEEQITGDTLHYLPLRRVILPDNVVKIGNSAFEWCVDLENVNLPSSLKTISDRAFFCCQNLTSINLPEGLECIGNEALRFLSSLEEIVFPSTLKSLGESSCESWDCIRKVSCKAMEPPVCASHIDEPERTPFGIYNTKSPASRENPVLYVPTGTTKAYGNSFGWDYFSPQIHESDGLSPSSVEMNIKDATRESYQIYDLSGRQITNPSTGQMYIINGKITIKTY